MSHDHAQKPRLTSAIICPRILVCTLLLLLISAASVRAEIPTILSDKIHKGSGVIDILRDTTNTELDTYLDSTTLYLGVDLNEDLGGNETKDSLGVAIDQMELVIITTDGEFTFDEFYTNTTAMIETAGSTESQEYYTLFGSTGSNEISGSTTGFDIGSFDDVVQIRNVEYTGEILSAELRVSFVETSGVGEAETFFDYSDGFEEFAILEGSDAALLDAANIGVAAAVTSVEYTYYSDIDAAVGAPEPMLVLSALVPLMLYGLGHRRG
jgi:hypothetical protein